MAHHSLKSLGEGTEVELSIKTSGTVSPELANHFGINEIRKCLSLGTLAYKEFSVTKLTFLSHHIRKTMHFGLPPTLFGGSLSSCSDTRRTYSFTS